MTEPNLLAFNLPAVSGKKPTVDFAGGNQSSDAGMLLLRGAERCIGVCRRLAGTIVDRRDPGRIHHRAEEIVTARVMAIASGHKDANDHDRLRHDPLLKMAVGRAPESGAPLATQSTISRFENAPSKHEAARLTAALVDQFAETVKPGAQEVIDIDDTVDVVHGNQQLSFFNAHHDERCFMPAHIVHVASGAPVTAILRTGKTPKGSEVRTIIKHTTRRLRRNARWRATHVVWRGDSHYGRPQAMEWCEANDAGFIFGLAGNPALARLSQEAADRLSLLHAASDEDKMRGFTSFAYQAGSWTRPRRVIARLEATMRRTDDGWRQDIDIRYIVTSLKGDPRHLYEDVYCKRGQAENLIKLSKAQLASDRTSCTSAVANQVRLVLATAAFWLMREVKMAAAKIESALARAEFNTIRLRLIKIAARVVEHATRIRVHLPASCPEAATFRAIALGLMPAGP